ncbi:hypothetical protein BT96DRAFT_1004700 [Gymnopus androsaceus JB14]|uniref:Ubiquitin-like protein ATG12 n=1 Tax=Gymnopus androsaceus JB14 TaxID=1447944 RepID=A0A6A4GRU1_9AGAR|nr:hypothetical protein BT96DRAFT_1004700 [Gymnopus androsaceus JB14]
MTDAAEKKDADKVIVRFKAVSSCDSISSEELGYKGTEPLHTYINLAFSPAPDDTVANLFKSFQTDNHLIVNYSTTAAWG